MAAPSSRPATMTGLVGFNALIAAMMAGSLRPLVVSSDRMMPNITAP
jgi:hypothetical protein